MIARRKRFLSVSLFLTGLLLLGWLLFREMSVRAYNPQIEFDAQSWASDPILTEGPSRRQMMIRDLVSNVLPCSNKTQLDCLLGFSSPPREDGRQGELSWDSAYIIGYQQKLLEDNSDGNPERKMETLFIRFDTNANFESWFIDGFGRWPQIVGKKGARTYRPAR